MKSSKGMRGLPQIIKARSPRRSDPQCPDCQVAMRPYACDTSVIFKCDHCHGLWLSHGRPLGTFRKALERFDYEELEIYLHDEQNRYSICYCRRCRQVLEEFNYGYNSGVTLYRCRRCQGMWMPLRQMIHLMNSIKVGKSIAGDIRAVLVEWRLLHGNIGIVQSVWKLLTA